MKKRMIIIISAIVILIIVGVVAILLATSKNLKVNSIEDLASLVNQIYEEHSDIIPTTVDTIQVDPSDTALVKAYTGLENGDDLEYIVVSEPMISSQPYSLVLTKVKNGANPNQIAKSMKDGVNARKWISVSAEKVYATSSGNIVCLIMADEDIAKTIYESFKNIAGKVGEKYERTVQEQLTEDELQNDLSETAIPENITETTVDTVE